MTLASSWTDLIVGVDIHIHLVPGPGAPVPTPIAQPYVGMVGDPVGAVVGAITNSVVSLVQAGRVELPKGPVLINGFPAATTNDIGKNTMLLPHMPMPPGISHVKKPSGEASLPLGVLKTTFGGANPVLMGYAAISCGDPPLPTSKVIAIPKGPPVMIMGAPGIDAQSALAKWAMGKVVRTAFTRVSKLAKRVAKLAGPRLRNLISKNRCTSTGHPVDVATGRVFTSAIDFELPGTLPLVFERSYFSSWAHRDGVMGPGWSHSLDQAVWIEYGVVVYRNSEGQEIVFDFEGDPHRIERGRECFEPFSRNTLVKTRDGWRLTTPEGLLHHFATVPSDAPRSGYFHIVKTTTRDPLVAIEYRYDNQARLFEVKDSAGRVVKIGHDAHGRIREIRLPHPDQADEWLLHVGFQYSTDGVLEEAADALGQVTRYAYDGALMVQETDRNGVSFFWIYDGGSSEARCVRTWGQSGDHVIYNQKLDYDLKGRVTLVTDSYNNKTLYRLNEIGAVVAIVDALGGETLRTYDESLQLVAEVDCEGRTTKHQYSARGQLVMTVLPGDGGQRVWKYDARFPELLKLFRNEAGAVWRHRYDDRARLIETQSPERDVFVSYEWHKTHLRSVSHSGARTVIQERDADGNATVVELPTGGIVRQKFDRLGRMVAATNPYGGVETRTYDLGGRILEIREESGAWRRFAHDPEGNVTEMRDASRLVRCAYSGWNRLSSREEGDANGTPGAKVKFVWGAEGELREVRNEKNHEYRFEYDPCLRVEREIGFDLQETRYKRDRSGGIVKISKPRAKVHTDLTLDAVGRIVERKNSDGTFARFVYRRDGAMLEATNQTTTVNLERDALGRVIKEVQGGVEVSSHYAAGFRSRIESSLDAGLLIGRDANGNPSSYSTLLADRGWTNAGVQTFDVAGFEQRRELPGGISVEWRRDQTGRPTDQRTVRGNQLDWDRRYEWSPHDEILAIADTRFGTSRFAHDVRGRLIEEARVDGETIHRAFDDVGNVYRTPTHEDRRYVRGGVIRNDGETTFAFDQLGNLIEKTEARGIWQYEWDGDGMLTKVHCPDGVDVDFSYDALGRRVSKKVGERETKWVWDGDVILHEVRSNAAPVTWYHEPESFTPLMRVEGGLKRQHIVADHIGTPTALYDDAGKLAWQMQLDLFGVTNQVGDGDVPMRWPGQYEDPETALYYNRFRYYDPCIGQYVSADPIGIAGGTAARAFVQDPQTWMDPYGLSACPGELRLGKLTSIGPGEWQSTGGLLYKQGSIHGNRVRHVLAHSVPDPTKRKHSVFSGGSRQVLPVIDEAWLGRGPGVTQAGGNVKYRTAMGRAVGTGGESVVEIVIKKGTAADLISAFVSI